MSVVARPLKIESLAAWGDPIEVDTVNGPKRLRKAVPTDRFWDAWRSDKPGLKESGVSVGKDRLTGSWSLTWWLPLDEEMEKERAEVSALSRATGSDLDVPAPEGLSYLPYQVAGIEYALRVFGDL